MESMLNNSPVHLRQGDKVYQLEHCEDITFNRFCTYFTRDDKLLESTLSHRRSFFPIEGFVHPIGLCILSSTQCYISLIYIVFIIFIFHFYKYVINWWTKSFTNFPIYIHIYIYIYIINTTGPQY